MPRLTVKEAAEYLRVGVQTLNNLRVKGGGPPYIKMGAAVRYDTEDLDAWIDQKKRQSTSAVDPPTPRPRKSAA
jgi:excisionase family DNA binding protein